MSELTVPPTSLFKVFQSISVCKKDHKVGCISKQVCFDIRSSFSGNCLFPGCAWCNHTVIMAGYLLNLPPNFQFGIAQWSIFLRPCIPDLISPNPMHYKCYLLIKIGITSISVKTRGSWKSIIKTEIVTHSSIWEKGNNFKILSLH